MGMRSVVQIGRRVERSARFATSGERTREQAQCLSPFENIHGREPPMHIYALPHILPIQSSTNLNDYFLITPLTTLYDIPWLLAWTSPTRPRRLWLLQSSRQRTTPTPKVCSFGRLIYVTELLNIYFSAPRAHCICTSKRRCGRVNLYRSWPSTWPLITLQIRHREGGW